MNSIRQSATRLSRMACGHPLAKRRIALALALILLLAGVHLVAADPAPATPPAAEEAAILGAGDPAISPDGSEIAFTWMGDIWIVSARGGEARRLTVHNAYDHAPRWSADGKRVAFSSNRHGNDDLFVIDKKGGRPRRLTWHSADDMLVGWSGNGNDLLFTSNRESFNPYLYTTRSGRSLPAALIRDRTVGAALSPDGKWICWVKGYTPWWRKHYRGSASRDLYLRRIGGGASVRLTDWEGDDDAPMWAADGRSIYYVSEGDDSTANIWRIAVDLDSDPPRRVGKPAEITKHDGWSIESAFISADGKRIAYERHGKIWTVPTGGGAPSELSIVARSDEKWNAVRKETFTDNATDFALSPDGEEIAFSVHGEIFVLGLDDGEATDHLRRITDTAARERHVAWSIDGTTLYFESDRAGNGDIYAVRSVDDEETRLSRSRRIETERLTDSPENDRFPVPSPDGEKIAFLRGIGYPWVIGTDGKGEKRVLDSPDVLYTRWSPDSKWLAGSMSNLGSLEDVYIFPADGSGEAYNISRSPMDDYSPFWTADGERLAWATRDDYGNLWLRYTWLTKEAARKSDDERAEEAEEEEKDGKKEDGEEAGEEKAAIVKIDFDHLYDRTVTVTRLSGGYNPFCVSPDGKFYAVLSDQLGTDDLWLVNDEGDKITRLTSGGGAPSNFRFEKDGRGLFFLHRHGKIGHVRFDDGGAVEGKPSAVAFSARVNIDLAAEGKQKFNEAWNLLYDGFYDARFHGVDWKALRLAYADRAAAAYTVEEFSDVLREMIGELSASHLGVYPPRGKGASTATTGFLVDDAYEGPGVRVGKVFDDSPAVREGNRVREGDFVIRVDGVDVGTGEHYFDLWDGKADEKVDVVLASSADGKNRRTVTIIPEGRGAIRRYIYEDWVDRSRALTDSLSGGAIGYVRMSAMGPHDIERFEKDLWAEAGDKEGLILDIRYNNGGSIHDQVITILQRRAYARMTSRERRDSFNPVERWDKPVVCLINERSYSDGEIFPHAFKTLGLGTLLGVPTYGAVIGTQNVSLIDGTVFRIPGAGWFSLDGRDLENHGVTPDIFVPSVPEELPKGNDAQLERAVEVLLEKVAPGAINRTDSPGK